MIHRYAAECIDRTLRDVCSCELPFGGKVIVMEDISVRFYSTRAQVVSTCINRSPLWHHLRVMELTNNMRQQSSDQQDSAEVSNFSEFLQSLGEGTEPENESNMIT